MSNIPSIGKKPAPEPVQNDLVVRILAFLIVVVPTAVSLNVLIWNVALWFGRQS